MKDYKEVSKVIQGFRKDLDYWIDSGHDADACAHVRAFERCADDVMYELIRRGPHEIGGGLYYTLKASDDDKGFEIPADALRYNRKRSYGYTEMRVWIRKEEAEQLNAYLRTVAGIKPKAEVQEERRSERLKERERLIELHATLRRQEEEHCAQFVHVPFIDDGFREPTIVIRERKEREEKLAVTLAEKFDADTGAPIYELGKLLKRFGYSGNLEGISERFKRKIFDAMDHNKETFSILNKQLNVSDFKIARKIWIKGESAVKLGASLTQSAEELDSIRATIIPGGLPSLGKSR